MSRPHPPAPSPVGEGERKPRPLTPSPASAEGSGAAKPGGEGATGAGRTPVAPPILELTRIRILAFFREPGAGFWVFVFPILMGLALGFAFREKPPEKIAVGIERGALPERVFAAVSSDPDLAVRAFSDDAEARRALTFGKIALLVEPGSPLRYRYEPTRPVARTPRLALDHAVQRAAGAPEPIP
ncbi:MAG TPA: hypothetical protein VG777_03870, partial [Thermoanaerobaculia bacterium]|nr:hypothetical protein [Thermoanaerobaculia bacterium]